MKYEKGDIIETPLGDTHIILGFYYDKVYSKYFYEVESLENFPLNSKFIECDLYEKHTNFDKVYLRKKKLKKLL